MVTSEVRGVIFDEYTKKWKAAITYNGITYWLIESDSKILCIQIRKAAETAIRRNTLNDFMTKLKKKREINRGYY